MTARRATARWITMLNWVNLTTPVGLCVAVAGRARIVRDPSGILIAGDYRLPVPKQLCFTIGHVVFCRHSAGWLLAEAHTALLRHESRHVRQYAIFGPLFWPLYAAAAAWSWLVCGGYAAYNPFERHAGLASGGYQELPLRGWAAALAVRRRSRR